MLMKLFMIEKWCFQSLLLLLTVLKMKMVSLIVIHCYLHLRPMIKIAALWHIDTGQTLLKLQDYDVIKFPVASVLVHFYVHPVSRILRVKSVSLLLPM